MSGAPESGRRGRRRPGAASPWLALATAMLLAACREEPTIVIRFEPQDLGAPRASAPLARAASLDAGDGSARDGASAAAGAATPAPAASPTTKESGEGRKGDCAGDGDCVAIRGDCCGCSAGGTARAVSRGQRAEAERALERRCGMTACPAVISTDRSCRQRPACRGHRCVLVDAGG